MLILLSHGNPKTASDGAGMMFILAPETGKARLPTVVHWTAVMARTATLHIAVASAINTYPSDRRDSIQDWTHRSALSDIITARPLRRALTLINDYIVSWIKSRCCYFCDNFVEFGLILIILFTVTFTSELRKSRNKSDHLASNLFPCYLVKF